MLKGIGSLIKIFFLALLTVVIAGILIKRDYDRALVTPSSDETQKVEVTVEESESIDSIAGELVEAGILSEKWANYFKIYVKLSNLYPKIQAGSYQLPKNLSIKEIVETIQHAQEQSIWVTLPEGLRKDEIANILSTEFVKSGSDSFSKEQFLNLTTDTEYISTLGLDYKVSNLEGFLFPDKYAFAPDATTQEVLETLIANFKRKVNNSVTYKDLIIASMVEREGYTSQDRPIIADIIKRRYNEGWLLQVDATILYPIKDWKYVITNKDKESDSAYNTYKRQGLPPTPICNPGVQSIEATMNPQSNNYYYYIHDKDGNAHYAETLTEHNQNIQKYLR